MNKKTRELVLAAILTALSILITYSPLKLVTPFFTLTLGSHVPTLLSMFLSPWVIVMTVIGSCIGFFLTIPAPNSIIVVARAAMHLIFALAGWKMIKEGRINIFLIILITGLLHALSEGIVVYILTPIILKGEAAAITAATVAFVGTAIHHLIDCAITAPIAAALSKAKIIHIPRSFRRYRQCTKM
ncbi:MAG: ECF transporter S component [Clostridiales bacterium]|nr:ECF transporter S component [Clostridiales bacterium]